MQLQPKFQAAQHQQAENSEKAMNNAIFDTLLDQTQKINKNDILRFFHVFPIFSTVLTANLSLLAMCFINFRWFYLVPLIVISVVLLIVEDDSKPDRSKKRTENDIFKSKIYKTFNYIPMSNTLENVEAAQHLFLSIKNSDYPPSFLNFSAIENMLKKQNDLNDEIINNFHSSVSSTVENLLIRMYQDRGINSSNLKFQEKRRAIYQNFLKELAPGDKNEKKS